MDGLSELRIVFLQVRYSYCRSVVHKGYIWQLSVPEWEGAVHILTVNRDGTWVVCDFGEGRGDGCLSLTNIDEFLLWFIFPERKAIWSQPKISNSQKRTTNSPVGSRRPSPNLVRTERCYCPLSWPKAAASLGSDSSSSWDGTLIVPVIERREGFMSSFGFMYGMSLFTVSVNMCYLHSFNKQR